jgi:glycosyltransferase involved in cell wall biosynthesis
LNGVSAGTPGGEAVDVLVVSLGSTAGLRAADAELVASLRRAGASVALVAAEPPERSWRTLALTDLAWALAARRVARASLASRRVGAVVYSSTTAALLWPRPGAIRFDAPATGNRPGRHGLWQRPLERRRLREAPLLLPWSEGGLREAPASARRGERALVLPVPVEPSDAGAEREAAAVALGEQTGEEDLGVVAAPGGQAARDIAAIAYAANPAKKGIDRVLAAWRRARRPGERLVLVGASAEDLRRSGLDRLGLDRPDLDPAGEDGVQVVGLLAPGDYRALLLRARVFLSAPRREDYGLAQLEALAAGCMLVTTPAPGPYVALPIARRLDPRLVSEDLGAALRAALDTPTGGYPERAAELMKPFGRAIVDRIVADELLPRLLSGTRLSWKHYS